MSKEHRQPQQLRNVVRQSFILICEKNRLNQLISTNLKIFSVIVCTIIYTLMTVSRTYDETKALTDAIKDAARPRERGNS